MSIDSRAVMNALTSLAASTGVFETVIGHEPKAAPARTGMTCAVQWIGMRAASSGQSSVSVRLEFWARCFTSMLQEPQDAIDPAVLDAADALFLAVIGEFQLGLSDVRYVDVFGADGEPLVAEAGYIEQDKVMFRTVDIKIGIVVNDAYTEAA